MRVDHSVLSALSALWGAFVGGAISLLLPNMSVVASSRYVKRCWDLKTMNSGDF